MNKKEFAQWTMALKTFFPRENLLPNEQAMELWYGKLQDIPYQVATVVLDKWVSLNKYSPSIAEIKEMAVSITCGDLPDWGDAWEEVCRAIRKFGFYRSQEALESLSPLAKKATMRMGFSNLCLSENQSADRANFRMIYEQLAEREKNDAQLSLPLKQAILEIQTGQNILRLESESNEWDV